MQPRFPLIELLQSRRGIHFSAREVGARDDGLAQTHRSTLTEPRPNGGIRVGGSIQYRGHQFGPPRAGFMLLLEGARLKDEAAFETAPNGAERGVRRRRALRVRAAAAAKATKV